MKSQVTMNKFIIGTIILIINSSASAFQLISEKKEIPSDLNASIKSNDYIVGKISSYSKKLENSLKVSTKTYNSDGKLNEYASINSSHSFCLYNYSSKPVHTGYHFELDAMENRMYDEKKFMLDANEFFCTGPVFFNLVFQAERTGHFTITAKSWGKDENIIKEVVDYADLNIRS